jgi:hypothetical protein
MSVETGGSPQASYRHQAFGLIIRSCMPLPELLTAGETAAAHDVDVTFGRVPGELPDAVARGVRFQAAPGKLLLHVDEVAHFFVADGRTIVIQRDPAGDDDGIRAFLMTAVIGALLHQRDDLVLHGSAIGVTGQGVAFLGYSGAGKSTLAAAFRQRGYPVLTDDLCVVRPTSDGQMAIYPGFPQMKLWLDSLNKLNVSAEGLRRLQNKLEKRALPLSAEFARAPLPAKKLYVLLPSAGSELSLRTVNGPEKFNLLKEHTYRFGLLASIEQKAAHFQLAMALARQVPLAVAVRPVQPFRLDDLTNLIEQDFER